MSSSTQSFINNDYYLLSAFSIYFFLFIIIVCSPWDLELSHYVLERNIRPPAVPKALLVGALKPASVIEYLKS